MSGTDASVYAVSALLSKTEAAHGQYETTELQGVYDQAWPAWYGAYAVEHGLGEVIGHAITAEQLTAFLTNAWTDFAAADPKPSEGWAAYTARRIVAEL